jgi:hypothetical protein
MLEKKTSSVYDLLPDEQSVFPKTMERFADLDRAIDELVIDKRVSPFFRRSDRFYTQGSCFAEHIHNALVARGYPSYWNKWIEDINSPLALAAIADGLRDSDEEVAAIRASNVAIITVGVAPCWFRKDNNAFVLANQLNLKKMDQYYQRTLSVQESSDFLLSALGKYKRLNPAIKLVLTLSPVPLARTFEFHSAVVADAVSKSVLRAAIHEAVQKSPNDIFYFPSYEIVTWLGRYHGGAFGEDEGSPRHVSAFYIDAILEAFIRNYKIID